MNETVWINSSNTWLLSYVTSIFWSLLDYKVFFPFFRCQEICLNSHTSRMRSRSGLGLSFLDGAFVTQSHGLIRMWRLGNLVTPWNELCLDEASRHSLLPAKVWRLPEVFPQAVGSPCPLLFKWARWLCAHSQAWDLQPGLPSHPWGASHRLPSLDCGLRTWLPQKALLPFGKVPTVGGLG